MNVVRRKGVEKISALLDLELNYSHAKHNFELGLPLEDSLKHFFRPYFPSRYGFSSGYIVDDTDTVSNQTDWLIYDSHNFSPLLAKIHGSEGAEWFPFDSVYGCVEVKRTLTISALEEAIKQIANTRKLRREPTNLLQVSPYIRIPEKVLHVSPDATFHEVCNSLYIGIYAFLPGDYSDPNDIYNKIEEMADNLGQENMPDFIAVHGHYYIRKAIRDKASGKLTINPFMEQANTYITVDCHKLTAGVFYTDLIYQFSNTNLSALRIQSDLGAFLQSEEDIKISGVSEYA
ncbi:hypothetical protein G8770_23430 [Aestuariicella hydrocarbonica]|uniref:DUF6602 domain-containing protein n=1 Tax=Pseudomaricurvus hydrocarbonicus TaxID=1470433 RepID=A0A9E5MQL1_9GAMM|nr:DUF6602 domain-containing protein [Aestuariicella hydrocarbonica]NHO68515.1 hypothetical protein [Aestuariicella hydrocarbonica]